jgi:4-hydroxyphenylpyruvate dioxygenase
VHDIEPKLDQAALNGLDVELFYEDLYYLAKTFDGGPSPDNQLRAAKAIRSMCKQRSISVVCLQPFMHYEGLRDRERHRQKIKELKLWVELAQALGTHIISIPSTFLNSTEVSGDTDLIVRDLREAADIAESAGIQIAYESLAWGTYSDTWEQAWQVVESVNRPNFGIVLDTFNLAARVFADPTAPNRRNSHAEEDIRTSLERMADTIDISKVFYVQVVDAEYLAEPLVEGHQYYKADQHPRMSWSRNCRLFYGEHDRGAYLPIRAILKVILDLGYEGWLSAELFNASLFESDPSVPEEHASRAAQSWQKIVKDFNLTEKLHKTAAPRCSSKPPSRAQL